MDRASRKLLSSLRSGARPDLSGDERFGLDKGTQADPASDGRVARLRRDQLGDGRDRDDGRTARERPQRRRSHLLPAQALSLQGPLEEKRLPLQAEAAPDHDDHAHDDDHDSHDHHHYADDHDHPDDHHYSDDDHYPDHHYYADDHYYP